MIDYSLIRHYGPTYGDYGNKRVKYLLFTNAYNHMDVIAGIHAHAHDNSTCCVPGVLLTHPLLGAQCSDLIRGVSVSGGGWHGTEWGPF